MGEHSMALLQASNYLGRSTDLPLRSFSNSSAPLFAFLIISLILESDGTYNDKEWYILPLELQAGRPNGCSAHQVLFNVDSGSKGSQLRGLAGFVNAYKRLLICSFAIVFLKQGLTRIGRNR